MDLISRQAAIDAADRTDYTGLSVEDVKKVTDEVVKELKQLPSAQPERKTAYWKTHIFDGIMGGRPRAYMCGYCNFISLAQTNYCPHCGTKMEVENETH